MRRMLLVSGVVLGVATLGACSSGSGGGGGDAAANAGGALSRVGAGGGTSYDSAKLPQHVAAPAASSGIHSDAGPLALGESKIITAAMTVAVKGAANVTGRATQAGSI